jgi:uncharacterized membrane protein HdeD (DUF308 family)
MLHALARNWWALLIRGIAALIFGLLAFFWPGATGFALVILFGAYAFVDGIFALISAVRAAEAHERWWAFLLEGIVGLVIAAITLFHPVIAALALYFTIAVWAILTGILEIVAAVQMRKLIPNEFWLILGGILSIIFGILLFVFPAIGILTVIYLIGFYAILFGIVMIVFSFRLRRHATT